MMDSNVVQWAPGHDGSLYVVDADSQMWRESITTQGWRRLWVDCGVRSFAVLADDSLVVLRRNGDLVHEVTEWRLSGECIAINNNIGSFAINGSGCVVATRNSSFGSQLLNGLLSIITTVGSIFGNSSNDGNGGGSVGAVGNQNVGPAMPTFGEIAGPTGATMIIAQNGDGMPDSVSLAPNLYNQMADTGENLQQVMEDQAAVAIQVFQGFASAGQLQLVSNDINAMLSRLAAANSVAQAEQLMTGSNWLQSLKYSMAGQAEP